MSASSENIAKKMKAEKTVGHSTSAGHSMHTIDILTSDGSVNLSQAGTPIHLGSSENLSQDQQRKNNVTSTEARVRSGYGYALGTSGYGWVRTQQKKKFGKKIGYVWVRIGCGWVRFGYESGTDLNISSSFFFFLR